MRQPWSTLLHYLVHVPEVILHCCTSLLLIYRKFLGPQVDLRGLFGGGAISDLISGIATDVLPDVVEEYEPEITQLAMEYINEFIRKILHREYPTIAAVG